MISILGFRRGWLPETIMEERFALFSLVFYFCFFLQTLSIDVELDVASLSTLSTRRVMVSNVS